MTKEELSKYYYLSLEIKQIEAKISEINDTYMSASKINGMPKSHKISNPQEERRLFYVALTRTKNKIYMLVPKSKASSFAREIKNYANVEIIKNI